MHDVWLIGFAAGAGAAFGLLLAGVLGSLRGAAALATFGAAAAGAGFGLIFGWPNAIGGGIGGMLGGFGATTFVGGSIRRGGTAGGTALLLSLAAVGTFVLALVPFVGYLEAAALPALAVRARKRAGEKYAGLRTLAR